MSHSVGAGKKPVPVVYGVRLAWRYKYIDHNSCLLVWTDWRPASPSAIGEELPTAMLELITGFFLPSELEHSINELGHNCLEVRVEPIQLQAQGFLKLLAINAIVADAA